jgi:hypothetical protein
MVREKEGAKKNREEVYARREVSPVTLVKWATPSMSVGRD